MAKQFIRGLWEFLDRCIWVVGAITIGFAFFLSGLAILDRFLKP